MKQNGIEFKKLNNDKREKIIDMYFKGKNKNEIINISGASQRAVSKVIKEAGLIFRRKNRYTLNELYFDSITTEAKAYLLGIIYADGCITKTNYFAISMIDKEPLELLKEEINYTGKIYIPKRIDNPNWSQAYRINFSSKNFCECLREHGVLENKSLITNTLPDIRFDLIHHFLRGYFDGDGCISNYIQKDGCKRTTCYFIVTDKLAKVLKDMFYEILKYECKIDDSKTIGMKYLRLHNKTAIKKMFNYLYHDSTYWIERKYQKWQQFLSNLEERSSIGKMG